MEVVLKVLVFPLRSTEYTNVLRVSPTVLIVSPTALIESLHSTEYPKSADGMSPQTWFPHSNDGVPLQEGNLLLKV